jgi:hypothetical protein
MADVTFPICNKTMFYINMYKYMAYMKNTKFKEKKELRKSQLLHDITV